MQKKKNKQNKNRLIIFPLYVGKYPLFGCRTLLQPVSFLKELTEFRRKRFGINEPGDDPFSLQSGHSLSSDSSRAVRTPNDKSKQHPSFSKLLYVNKCNF